MPSQERSPYESDTLIFPNPEQAGDFRERVEKGWEKTGKAGTRRKKDIVQDEVAKEFEKYGQGVQTIKKPWEHTPAEHEETQQLVDLAFAKDLGVALRAAQKSEHYPRNLDLFHDLLTGEMYDLLKQSKINKQPVAPWLITMAVLWIIVISLLILMVSIS